MTDLDRQPFATALLGLAETFGAELSEAQIEGYWTALNHLPLDQVRSGIFHTMQSCRFLPKPAEIIAASKAMREQPNLHDGTNYALPAESREERLAYWAGVRAKAAKKKAKLDAVEREEDARRERIRQAILDFQEGRK